MLFYLLTTTPALAQLLVSEVTSSSGFGGAVLKTNQVNDESVVPLGRWGGVILNQRFVIDAGFYRLVGDIKAPETTQTSLRETVDLDMDYVGLDLEYIIASHRPIHFSIQTLVGTRRAQYWEGDDTVLAEDGIWVIGPSAHVMLNITFFFELDSAEVIGLFLVSAV